MAWAKTSHPTNPTSQEELDRMSDAKDFYVILHSAVTTAGASRSYKYDDHGEQRTKYEATEGNLLYQGSCVPAKAFGLGVDLQRLVDLGAIRQATYEETEAVLADFQTKGRTGVESIVRPIDGPGVRVNEDGGPMQPTGKPGNGGQGGSSGQGNPGNMQGPPKGNR